MHDTDWKAKQYLQVFLLWSRPLLTQPGPLKILSCLWPLSSSPNTMLSGSFSKTNFTEPIQNSYFSSPGKWLRPRTGGGGGIWEHTHFGKAESFQTQRPQLPCEPQPPWAIDLFPEDAFYTTIRPWLVIPGFPLSFPLEIDIGIYVKNINFGLYPVRRS